LAAVATTAVLAFAFGPFAVKVAARNFAPAPGSDWAEAAQRVATEELGGNFSVAWSDFQSRGGFVVTRSEKALVVWTRGDVGPAYGVEVTWDTGDRSNAESRSLAYSTFTGFYLHGTALTFPEGSDLPVGVLVRWWDGEWKIFERQFDV